MILTMCQQQGAQPQTFRGISQRLGNKTPTEVGGSGRAGDLSPSGSEDGPGQGEHGVAKGPAPGAPTRVWTHVGGWQRF